MSHPAVALEEIVHQRVRLGILTVLAEMSRADFGFVREALEVTAGNLSKHLQVLEGAGYVQMDKVFEKRRPRTWLQLTPNGRAAFDKEMGALSALVKRARAGQASGQPPGPAGEGS